MAKAITKGDTQELRMARLLFAEGSFVRRAIDLNLRFGEDLTVTDLDILALSFSDDLRVSLTIGESKSGQGKKGPKLADRLLWLRGLRELVDADFAFVATAKPASDRVRGLAERLAIDVLDESDLLHRERIHGLAEQDSWGPYDPSLLDRQRQVYDRIKKSQDLKRVYWFVRSEFWLLDVTTGVKRAFGAMRILGRYWDSRPNQDEREALAWLARHLHVNIVVGLVRMAGRSYREDPPKSTSRLLKELSSGPDLDYETLTRISHDVDRYVTALLRDLNADPGKHASALGAFNPRPPAYFEPLVEVVERLAAAPEAARELPRFADLRLAEQELGHPLATLRFRADLSEECDRLLRLVAAFLTGQLKISPEIFNGSTDQRNSGESQPSESENSGTVEKSDSRRDPPSETLFEESTEPLKLQ
jgi:hypothetical protein